MTAARQSSPVCAPEGVLYSSTGEAYVAEAVRSAQSSVRHNDLPHLIFASTDTGEQPGLSITRFRPSINGYVDKIANMRNSPFERTIYLDTDTFVIGEIAHLLKLLDHFDLAVAYECGPRGRSDPDVPSAFCEFNTGVVAWRANERTAAFLRSWEQTYLAWLSDEPFAGASRPSQRRQARKPQGSPSWGGTADQPAFRRCAWEHDLRVFVLAPEYNFRLGVPITVVDRVRVIHGRHPDYDALAERINPKIDKPTPRSFPQPRKRIRSRIKQIGKTLRPSASGDPGGHPEPTTPRGARNPASSLRRGQR